MTTNDESLIPWEQLEPLLKPGMTLRDLGNAIRAQTGLPFERYSIRLYGRDLRRGVRIVKREEHSGAIYNPNLVIA